MPVHQGPAKGDTMHAAIHIRRTITIVVTAVAAAFLAVATAPGGAVADAAPTPTATHLMIEYQASPAHPVVTFTLWCDPPGGSHEDPVAACKHLDSLVGDPFAPVPPGTICLQVIDGPETARVTGWWRGTPVNAGFNRVNSCEIDRWDNLVPVLPAHV